MSTTLARVGSSSSVSWLGVGVLPVPSRTRGRRAAAPRPRSPSWPWSRAHPLRRGVGVDHLAREEHRVGGGVTGHRDAVLGLDAHDPAHSHDVSLGEPARGGPSLRHSDAMTGMPLRTRAFTTVLDRLPRRSILDMDLRGHPAGPAVGGADRAAVQLGHRQGRPLGHDRHRRARGPRRRTACPSASTARRTATGPLPAVVVLPRRRLGPGQPRMYDPLCSFLAAEVGAVVLSVDYRMAPEHRAPTAALDCVDAVRQVAAHGGRWGADTVPARGRRGQRRRQPRRGRLPGGARRRRPADRLTRR